jgi:hypothetical protein
MTPDVISTIDELSTAAEEYKVVAKEAEKFEKRRKALSEQIKAGLRNGLGVQSPEGSFSAQLIGGGVVLCERKVRYDPIDNTTIPFFKSKGMKELVTEAIDRDEMNKAIKEGRFTGDELAANIKTVEIFSVKVVK